MKKILSFILILCAFCCCACCCENQTIVSNKAEAAEYKQVQAMHILVPTEAEAVQIREEIMQGQDQKEIFNNFMNAAKKYSKCPSGSSGGILGWFGKGDMVPEFENAAFNLPNGQVSEPIKTPYGWHLIYVISKK
ncbi:MAG: peptidyl-prolyl cis-trans isomerase [Candidatus Gastranaerophilales bacterium]|nr:peptidyl-prolyl cis-trans isomerase [Candidatus Gastranaerophilales bacterium]